MTPDEYVAALHAVGVPRNLPVHELDRQAAELLKVSRRSARRYRLGTVSIPGPVALAVKLMGERAE